jgi:hypothetical protein
MSSENPGVKFVVGKNMTCRKPQEAAVCEMTMSEGGGLSAVRDIIQAP